MCKRMRPLLLLLVMLPLWACEQGGRDQDPSVAKPGLTEGPRKLDLAMDHDFGVVPHGSRRSHEFELDLDLLGQPFVPLRVHLECSCGTADLRYRDADGNERFPDGYMTERTRGFPVEDPRFQQALKDFADNPVRSFLPFSRVGSRSNPPPCSPYPN